MSVMCTLSELIQLKMFIRDIRDIRDIMVRQSRHNKKRKPVKRSRRHAASIDESVRYRFQHSLTSAVDIRRVQ